MGRGYCLTLQASEHPKGHLATPFCEHDAGLNMCQASYATRPSPPLPPISAASPPTQKDKEAAAAAGWPRLPERKLLRPSPKPRTARPAEELVRRRIPPPPPLQTRPLPRQPVLPTPARPFPRHFGWRARLSLATGLPRRLSVVRSNHRQPGEPRPGSFQLSSRPVPMRPTLRAHGNTARTRALSYCPPPGRRQSRRGTCPVPACPDSGRGVSSEGGRGRQQKTNATRGR